MNRTEERHGVDPVDLVDRRERHLAVAHWLLTAAGDAEVARKEWQGQGVALLACGGIFAAVRLPGDLVRTVARTEDQDEVNAFLARALERGPVTGDRYADHYHALVPATTAWRWKPRSRRGLECLGRDCYLGVPSPDPDDPQGRSFWAVPMASPGALCDPRLVWAMVQLGTARQAAAAGQGT
ncbi:hypothetical protein [Streptomyces carpinensis]|uniref:Uncharacterized protein n=1 Tax=Streptomyces carpinensis TaxID=66369 RepID=A0ABV1VXQ2_9ACTN|nr:hypothetical protein [Streptomyces carpinensis]